AAAHHPAPALLHRVDPRTGLTDADFAVLARWLDRPGSRAPSSPRCATSPSAARRSGSPRTN
ncbi:hypothetical protein EF912_30600, partial [Streptomyces sp. WAC07061]